MPALRSGVRRAGCRIKSIIQRQRLLDRAGAIRTQSLRMSRSESVCAIGQLLHLKPFANFGILQRGSVIHGLLVSIKSLECLRPSSARERRSLRVTRTHISSPSVRRCRSPRAGLSGWRRNSKPVRSLASIFLGMAIVPLAHFTICTSCANTVGPCPSRRRWARVHAPFPQTMTCLRSAAARVTLSAWLTPDHPISTVQD
jgi:hypothetical protein